MFNIVESKDKFYKPGLVKITYELSNSNNQIEKELYADDYYTKEQLVEYLKGIIPNIDTNLKRIQLNVESVYKHKNRLGTF
jgi:hypothetical protein